MEFRGTSDLFQVGPFKLEKHGCKSKGNGQQPERTYKRKCNSDGKASLTLRENNPHNITWWGSNIPNTNKEVSR